MEDGDLRLIPPSDLTFAPVPRCMRCMLSRLLPALVVVWLLLPAFAPGQTAGEIEDLFWRSVECKSRLQVQAYLQEFPEGRYVAEAWACLEGQLGLDRAARRLVQQGLAALDYSAGVADGLFGPATRRAIRAWQAAKEFPGTGYLTREQADALIAQGNEAAAEQRQREEAQRQAKAEAERQRQEEEARRRAREAGRQRAAEAERQAREDERQRQEAARKRPQPGETFRDCPVCPELVVVPAGTFLMGSPSYEAGRDEDEGPVHQVTIGRPFAVGKYEVTVGEYGSFVETTGYEGESECQVWTGKKWEEESGRTWRDPGFRQTERDPVVCVSWQDAHAYTEWLSRQTDKTYRLLSEAEWEYVARAGTKTARYWGEREDGQCRYANGADQTVKQDNFGWTVAACDDGHYGPALVGSYQANGFRLYDMLGNVWEWVQDCWNDGYVGAPSDGWAWERGDCSRRVLRSGSWFEGPRFLRSAARGRNTPDHRFSVNGFRIARSVDEVELMR